jgi:hypothetical protein
MPQLSLKRFDITEIRYDNVIVLVGRRKSGKSIAIKDLMYYHQDIPLGTVISPTEGPNPFFSDFVPSLFIHDDYTPELLENVVKRQKLTMKKVIREKKQYGRETIDPRSFLILDDCLYDNIWAKDTNMKYLFMNGRHIKQMVVITMQYPLGIPPNLRTNIDYTFIFRENYINNRKRIYENYAGMFPNFESFCQVMDQCTENFECLVINNTSKSNKLEDQVFWYKADLHSDYTMGSKDFWNKHNELINDDGLEEEEVFDSKKFGRRRNWVSINVKKKY